MNIDYNSRYNKEAEEERLKMLLMSPEDKMRYQARSQGLGSAASEPTFTEKQQAAISKARNAAYSGAEAVQNVDVGGNALGGIAKVLTAWGIAKKGKKRNEAAATKLEEGANSDNAILAKALARKTRLADEALDLDQIRYDQDREDDLTKAGLTADYRRDMIAARGGVGGRTTYGTKQIREGTNYVTYNTENGKIVGEPIGISSIWEGDGIDADAVQEQADKASSQGSFVQGLRDYKGVYDELQEAGGLKEEATTGMQVAKNLVIAADTGLGISQAAGSKIGELRDLVESSKPQLTAMAAKAMGLTGQQMNSNFEFKAYMKGMTNTNESKANNMAHLIRLADRFGGEEGAAYARELEEKLVTTYPDEAESAMEASVYNADDDAPATQEEIDAELKRRGLL